MSSNKHAYLIIAHSNTYVLEKLILLLDDERNDIYIHIDKKTKDFDFDFFQNLPQKSNLYFTGRIDVRWGHVSQIQVELLLFRSASRNFTYDYYHLISGGDLTIKSQDEIHSFFQKNKGKLFLGFSNDSLDMERIESIHLFSKNMRVQEHEKWKRLGRRVRNLFLDFQRVIQLKYRTAREFTFVYGSNWVSVTHPFVIDLLEQEDCFLHFYKYSNCADEIYKHTFAYNSPHKDNIYSLDDELEGCQRFMDWKRGRPYTFRKEDFDLVMNSELLFARKFEDDVDIEIVDQIFNFLRKQ